MPVIPSEYIAVIRHILTALGVALTSRGLVTADDWQLYSGLIISAAPSVFAFIIARRQKRALAAVTTIAVASEFAKDSVPTETKAKEIVADKVKTLVDSTASVVKDGVVANISTLVHGDVK